MGLDGLEGGEGISNEERSDLSTVSCRPLDFLDP